VGLQTLPGGFSLSGGLGPYNKTLMYPATVSAVITKAVSTAWM
jgi:hypothetical protein